MVRGGECDTVPVSSQFYLLIHFQWLTEHHVQRVALLRQQAPVEGLPFVGALDGVQFVWHDAAPEAGRRVLVRVKQWHLAKLLVLKLLDLPLQRARDANVLEQAGVVVQPDFVFLRPTLFL